MGTHIEPPFMFKPVAVKGAVELQISCSRCDHGMHAEGKSLGSIPLDRAEDVYKGLGAALDEARALDASGAAASNGEAPTGLRVPGSGRAVMLPPELEKELVDRKMQASGDRDSDPSSEVSS